MRQLNLQIAALYIRQLDPASALEPDLDVSVETEPDIVGRDSHTPCHFCNAGTARGHQGIYSRLNLPLSR